MFTPQQTHFPKIFEFGRAVDYLIKLLCLILLCGWLNSAWAQPQSFEHVQIELLSEDQVWRAGETHTVAFKLEHEPHWHTYWQYPGDSGLPTKAKWTLPTGVSASELQFPIPKPVEVAGIHNIGFEGLTYLEANITVASDFEGDVFPLRAQLDWLICREECIPGRGEFALAIKLGAKRVKDPAVGAEFASAAAAMPVKVADGSMQFFRSGSNLEFVWPLADPKFTNAKRLGLFVGHDSLASFAPSPIRAIPNDGALKLSTFRELHESFTVLPTEVELLWWAEDSDGKLFAIQGSAKQGEASTGAMPSATPSASTLTLSAALFGAFLGGLLLNFMPCVLPVLSLKVLGMLGQSESQIRRQCAWFSGGVVLSFWVLAGVLLALRSSGEQLGWGFQMQSPAVVLVLCLVLLAFGLSMSGLWSFGTRFASVASAGDETSRGGALLSGLFAVVVASPCTAPLMAGALGFALTQSAAQFLLVISALALGFAAPMLAMVIKPSWSQVLPKPGAWMVALKHILAVPMYVSAVWLIWVFAQQRGIDAMAVLLLACLALGLALWAFEHFYYSRARTTLWASVSMGCAAIALSGYSLRIGLEPTEEKIIWETYSPELVAKLRAEEKPVLVEMTAAWCLTCKVNEKVAMSGVKFKQLAQEQGVTLVKGDWTDQDNSITQFLQSFGASGVPLVVIYGRNGETEVLPQVLTPAIVETALKKASASN